jgi:hypothetical protein
MSQSKKIGGQLGRPPAGPDSYSRSVTGSPALRDAEGSRSQRRETSATPVRALARSTPANKVIKEIRRLRVSSRSCQAGRHEPYALLAAGPARRWRPPGRPVSGGSGCPARRRPGSADAGLRTARDQSPTDLSVARFLESWERGGADDAASTCPPPGVGPSSCPPLAVEQDAQPGSLLGRELGRVSAIRASNRRSWAPVILRLIPRR